MTNVTRRYENDLVRSIVLGVLIGALALVLTVIAYTIGTHKSAAPGTAPASGTAPAPTGGGSAGAQAKQLFVQSGCGGCHAFAPAGTTGTLGPDLARASEGAKADNNMQLAAYLRQSITDPAAYVTPGYKAGVMPTYYSSKLTAVQIGALVAYIAAGQKS